MSEPFLEPESSKPLVTLADLLGNSLLEFHTALEKILAMIFAYYETEADAYMLMAEIEGTYKAVLVDKHGHQHDILRWTLPSFESTLLLGEPTLESKLTLKWEIWIPYEVRKDLSNGLPDLRKELLRH